VYGSEGYLVVDEPWIPAPDATTEILLYRADSDDQPERITVEPGAQYALEADAVARHLADRQAPQMSWDDSLGNMAALDAWRAAIGLSYPSERLDAAVPTVTGGPLRRRADHAMPYGTLPGLDKPVSRLVMGVDNQRDLVHASVMFDDFVERGGTAFDTAYIYRDGESERLLGRWIANRGVREDVVVVGKGAHTPHCDPESIPRQLAESLDRLGTDHVDLYLMHRDNEEVPVGEFVDVLDELWRAGRMRAFGGSNWSPARFEEANAYAAAHGRQGFAALSNHFGLARAYDVPWEGCRHVTDPESVAWLTDRQVPLLPWSSQARGFFARADPADTSDPELVRCYYGDENFARLARARQLGAELGVPATAVALAYVLHQPFPTFPLFGPRTLAETRTSLACLGVTLRPEQVRWLAAGV
jgi:aryl-alcohol dehydrogenase-like predicted oxidoreductase